MADDKTIDHLNHLISINKDAEAGFHTAADAAKNSELGTLFSRYAQQHAKFAAEIQQEVERLGGTFSGSGTLGEALHRGFLDIKSAFTGHSAAAILKSCKSGEESAEVAYIDAGDSNSGGRTHTLIERHRQQIQEFRTRLARLVAEMEDGLDFQKNE